MSGFVTTAKKYAPYLVPGLLVYARSTTIFMNARGLPTAHTTSITTTFTPTFKTKAKHRKLRSERTARPGNILVAKASTYEYPQYGNTAIFFVGNNHCKPHLVTFTGCCRRSNRGKMSAPRIALIEFASQERRKRDSGHHAIAGVDFFSCGVLEWLPYPFRFRSKQYFERNRKEYMATTPELRTRKSLHQRSRGAQSLASVSLGWRTRSTRSAVLTSCRGYSFYSSR